MNRHISTYLDFARFGAAILVLMQHARFLGFNLSYLSIHGSEAVAVFFVMSGFLMRHTTRNRENTAEKYAVARVARIVPVAILAIAFTWSVDNIGIILHAETYKNTNTYHEHQIVSILRYISFTNEAWNAHYIFGSDEPFWSLGYEIPYYILFGLAIFINGSARIVCLAIWAATFGFNVVALLPLWLLGIVGYYACKRVPFQSFQLSDSVRNQIGIAILILAVFAYIIVKRFAGSDTLSIYQVKNFGELMRTVIYFTSVGVIFLLSMIGVSMQTKPEGGVPQWLANIAGWLAGGTFTLYLIHQPMIFLLRSMMQDRDMSRMQGLLALFVIVVVAFLLAELAERRKDFSRMVTRTVFGQLTRKTVRDDAVSG